MNEPFNQEVIEVDIINPTRYWVIKSARVVSFILLPILISLFVFNRFGIESLSVALEWPNYIRWIGVSVICLDLGVMAYLANIGTRWGALIVAAKEIKIRSQSIDEIISVNSILRASIDKKWDSSIESAYQVSIVSSDGRSFEFLVQIGDFEKAKKVKMLMTDSSPV